MKKIILILLGQASTLFKSEYGRLRAPSLDDAGNLYFSTSNQDGRGCVKEGDDKVIKIGK